MAATSRARTNVLPDRGSDASPSVGPATTSIRLRAVIGSTHYAFIILRHLGVASSHDSDLAFCCGGDRSRSRRGERLWRGGGALPPGASPPPPRRAEPKAFSSTRRPLAAPAGPPPPGGARS